MKEIFKLLFDVNFWKTIKELIFIWYVKKFRKYYTHINELPLYNFAKIINGDFSYLYEKRHKRVPKVFFQNIFRNMSYQFKQLDNTYLRMQADAADYYAKYIRTGNIRWKNEYNTILNKLNKFQKSNFDLDEFLDYIERTFNHAPGSIDPKKISTSRAFSNFQKAKEFNLKKQKDAYNSAQRHIR